MSKSGQSVIIIGSFSNRVLTACFRGRSECARVGGVRKAVMISVTSVGNFVPRAFTFSHILMEKAWGRVWSDLRILMLCWHHTGMVEHLSDMWLCFNGSAPRSFFATLQPFFCVNRSPIPYDFRGGSKAIRYSSGGCRGGSPAPHPLFWA